MNITEIFQVLGIEETKDEVVIKRAYREKLSVTNPEDNPEGFKRLRAAYEEACAYARSTEEEAVQEEDITPSGLWGRKVAEIYNNMSTRRDAECWKTLFKEDVFLSLEEEENCIFKLLRFLMDHFKLPTDVWKLLDEKIHIVDNATGLREDFPADFVNYIVNRCRQGEDIEFDQFEGEPEADYDLFIQYSDKCWEALREGNLEQAQEYIKNADDLEIYHPIMELSRALLWEKQEKIEEAIAWMKKLGERFEDDLMVIYHTAEMLWRNERRAEAAEFYEGIKNKNKKHYMANMRLTEWYYELGRYKDAKKCAEEVLGMGGAEELRELLIKINFELEKEIAQSFKENPSCETGLELGWCYLQDGRFHEGIQHARDLEELITKEKDSEYKGLLAKLYVESADYKEAIQMAEDWEKALSEKLAGEQGEDSEESRKKDEDRVRQSYAIRAYCYRKLGYKDKEYFAKAIEAMEEAEKLSEEGKPDFNMLLEKAQIYLDMDEYEKCLSITSDLIEKYQIFAAFATAQKAYNHMWDAQGVIRSGYECIRYFPEYVHSYERIAKVYLDFKYTEDLKRILESAEQANVKSVFLDAYRYQMEHENFKSEDIDKKLEDFRKNYLEKLEQGKLEYYEQGLPIINEYLYAYPGTYMLVERALFHRAACRYKEAEEDFERALTEEPGNAYAYNGLAYMYKLQGKYERALVCIKKAILYFEEEFARSYSDMGDLYSLAGLHKMALDAYGQVLRVGGEKIRESAYYMRRYAYVLARNGQLEEAEKAISGAFENQFECYDELIKIYYSVGEREKAQIFLKRSHKLLNSQKAVKKSDYAKYYDSMAWAELVFGDGRKALKYFEKEIQKRSGEENIAGLYCDTIFACILCGDDVRGMLYSAKLRDSMQKAEAQGRTLFYEMDKIGLEREFFMKYYTATEQELEEILAREEKTNICYFCTYCICKELEGARLLHMLRMGRVQEVFERIESNMSRQPTDEFMLAIKNICKDGVKVVPYSVNGYPNRKQEISVEEKGAEQQDAKLLKDTKQEPATTGKEKEADAEGDKGAEKGFTSNLKKVLSSVFKGQED